MEPANHRPFDLGWAGKRTTNVGGPLLDGRAWDEYPGSWPAGP